jgi:ADP-ribosylglycohydrolase
MTFPLPNEHVLPHLIKLIPPPTLSQNNIDVNRFIGSLLGLAVGDALGASVEFRPHQYFVDRPVRDMEGGGTWGLKAGQWTDDTSMALCLASSLITKKGYDPYDQMVRYKWWYKHGYLSSTGQCFDIGNATRDSLEEFSRRQRILMKRYNCSMDEVDYLSWDKIQSVKEFNINCSSPGVAGNGALMRLSPLPLFFYKFPNIAVEYAGRSACLTHGDRKAVDACRYYAALIVAAVRGEPKSTLLSNNFYENHRKWFGPNDLDKEILRIARGSYKKANGYDDGIRGKGYIVNALEAALWAFWSDKDSFEKGALDAVNLGDDTDTTAAIYGQLAGAYYGIQKIPEKWLNKLYANKQLNCIGQWLYFEGSQYKGQQEEQNTASTTQSPTIYSSASNKQQSDIYHISPHQLNISSTGNHPKDTKYTSTLPSNHDLLLQYQNDDRLLIQQQNGKQGLLRQFNVDHFHEQYQDADQARTPHRTTEQPPTYQPKNYQPLEHQQHVSTSYTRRTDLNQFSTPGMGNLQTAGDGSDFTHMKKQHLESKRSLGNQSGTYSTVPYTTELNVNGYPYGANQTRIRFPENDHNLRVGDTRKDDLQMGSQNTQRYANYPNDPNYGIPTSTMNRPLALIRSNLPNSYLPNQTSASSSNKYYRKDW